MLPHLSHSCRQQRPFVSVLLALPAVTVPVVATAGKIHERGQNDCVEANNAVSRSASPGKRATSVKGDRMPSARQKGLLLRGPWRRNLPRFLVVECVHECKSPGHIMPVAVGPSFRLGSVLFSYVDMCVCQHVQITNVSKNLGPLRHVLI